MMNRYPKPLLPYPECNHSGLTRLARTGHRVSTFSTAVRTRTRNFFRVIHGRDWEKTAGVSSN
jgi:hypothetical protein